MKINKTLNERQGITTNPMAVYDNQVQPNKKILKKQQKFKKTNCSFQAIH